MDTVLLKTFLEVARLRHFGKAADKLCVTQSAVSARVKQLEDALGMPLFERKRNDIGITPAGERLLKHAENLVYGWERARQEVVMAPEVETVMAIGFAIDLWSILVRGWVDALRREHEELALRLAALPHNILVEQLIGGYLDMAILFEPPYLPDFEVRRVAEVPLILVSSHEGAEPTVTGDADYVYVDWGSSFAVSHAQAHGGRAARIQANVGMIAADLIRDGGGSAYLAGQTVDAVPAEPVRQSPLIERSAYMVYRIDHPQAELLASLAKLLPA